jgi:hypothetical protein
VGEVSAAAASVSPTPCVSVGGEEESSELQQEAGFCATSAFGGATATRVIAAKINLPALSPRLPTLRCRLVSDPTQAFAITRNKLWKTEQFAGIGQVIRSLPLPGAAMERWTAIVRGCTHDSESPEIPAGDE